MNVSKDLRYEVLRVLQLFTMIATVLATISNIVNSRPLHVVAQPALATVFVLYIWVYQKKSKRRKYISKIIFMSFFNLLYLPIAWYYSPGITSAIGYYAILIIVLSVFFVEKLVEFALPIFSLLFSVFMIRYELANPSHFAAFPDRVTHLNDVTFNFAAVTILMFSVITYVNRHYVNEKEVFYNLSITDELTGVYNRRYLLNALEQLTSELKGQQAFHLIFIDVNNFKDVNDTFGHHTGDDVLIMLGQLLHNKFEICGRFGGDEFLAIVLDSDINKVKDMIYPVESAFDAYAKENDFKGLSISFGITSSENKSADEIIKEADQYMYAAKHVDKISKEASHEL